MALAKDSDKKFVGVYITKAQHGLLQKEAERIGSSVSTVVRSILADWAERSQKRS